LYILEIGFVQHRGYRLQSKDMSATRRTRNVTKTIYLLGIRYLNCPIQRDFPRQHLLVCTYCTIVNVTKQPHLAQNVKK
jgi:hypothetical protein